LPVIPGVSWSSAALAGCVLTGLIFDGLHADLLGDLGPAGYTIWVCAFTLALAAVVAYVTRNLSARVTLASWLVFEGLIRFDATPTVGIPLATLTVACLFVTTGWIAPRADPIGLGVTVGAALCVGFILAPATLASAQSPSWIAGLPEWTHVGAGFAATLLLLSLLLRLD
jgi:F0F1-type ATP synthase membrane subunit c/vacuolar-type H+-ATPase subunit K